MFLSLFRTRSRFSGGGFLSEFFSPFGRTKARCVEKRRRVPIKGEERYRFERVIMLSCVHGHG